MEETLGPLVHLLSIMGRKDSLAVKNQCFIPRSAIVFLFDPEKLLNSDSNSSFVKFLIKYLPTSQGGL